MIFHIFICILDNCSFTQNLYSLNQKISQAVYKCYNILKTYDKKIIFTNEKLFSFKLIDFFLMQFL